MYIPYIMPDLLTGRYNNWLNQNKSSTADIYFAEQFIIEVSLNDMIYKNRQSLVNNFKGGLIL